VSSSDSTVFGTFDEEVSRMAYRLRLLVPALLAVGLLVILSGAKVDAGEASLGGGVTVYRDVQYGSADGYTLLLDAFIPSGPPHPAVILIHGGGWAYGDKREFDPEGLKLAGEGFAAFSINYRLSPPGGSWHVPAAIEDVHSAVAWVRANAASYAVDPAHVGAIGSSAGANLALMAATTGVPGVDRVDAAASWSGPTELRQLADQQRGGAGEAVRNYVGCAPQDCADRWSEASPLEQVTPASAPIYLANSTDELIPLSQAEEMARALQQAGVPHVLRVLQGHEHAKAYEDQVWNQTVEFLRLYLGVPTPVVSP
jgi:acetyl esterase